MKDFPYSKRINRLESEFQISRLYDGAFKKDKQATGKYSANINGNEVVLEFSRKKTPKLHAKSQDALISTHKGILKYLSDNDFVDDEHPVPINPSSPYPKIP